MPRGTAARSRGCPAPTIRETNLYIFGTGNPTPAYTPGRGDETMDNLFTGSLIAVNVDTGKMAWYYQTAPHDMHDWDSAQTPVLVDAMFKGRMRKLVMTAARNGYFFVLDRVTGEHLADEQVRLGHQLGEESRREGPPEAQPGEGSDGRRIDRLAERRRHDQLGAARVFSGHRTLLRLGGQHLFDLLSARHRSARFDGAGRQARKPRRHAAEVFSPRSTTAPARRRGATSTKGAPAVAAACSRRPASWCSPATAPATSSRTTPIPARRCGTRRSAASPTRRRPIMLDGRQYLLVATGDTLWAFVMS